MGGGCRPGRHGQDLVEPERLQGRLARRALGVGAGHRPERGGQPLQGRRSPSSHGTTRPAGRSADGRSASASYPARSASSPKARSPRERCAGAAMAAPRAPRYLGRSGAGVGDDSERGQASLPTAGRAPSAMATPRSSGELRAKHATSHLPHGVVAGDSHLAKHLQCTALLRCCGAGPPSSNPAQTGVPLQHLPDKSPFLESDTLAPAQAAA